MADHQKDRAAAIWRRELGVALVALTAALLASVAFSATAFAGGKAASGKPGPAAGKPEDPQSNGVRTGNPRPAKGRRGHPRPGRGSGDARGRRGEGGKGRAEGRKGKRSRGGSRPESSQPKGSGKAKGRGKGRGPKAPGQSGRPGDRPRGKTTICHATGSDSNPYVTITISNSALAAHRRHRNGEDIIPAPAGGCPKGGGSKGPDQPGRPGDSPPGKTTICHATGSDSNPYVTITISNSALAAHQRHQNGEDIIPAPPGGCPGPAGASETPVTPQTAEPGPGPVSATPAPAEGERPAQADATPSAPGSPGRVLGATAESPQGGAAGQAEDSPGAQPASGVAGARASGRLPFTGFEVALIALLGATALGLGLAARSRARESR